MMMLPGIGGILPVNGPILLNAISFGRESVDAVFRWSVGPTVPFWALWMDEETLLSDCRLRGDYVMKLSKVEAGNMEVMQHIPVGCVNKHKYV